jgi:uncharacterized caspase-like protein
MGYHRGAQLATIRWRPIHIGAAVLLALGGAANAQAPVASRPIQPDDLLVVDCLLPGQVRQLGRQTTYISARRPARLPARDCAIRGGEYVAADRASGETSLAVWLDAARGGDAEAATIVGEIYERGLAGRPDYAKAVEWYRRAADTGSARAKVNLGYLYERGLGVGRDGAEALRWYRAAAGAGTALALDPGDAPAATDARLQREVDALRGQIDRLQRELDAARAAAAPQPRAEPPTRPARDERTATIAPSEAQIAELRLALERESARSQSLLTQSERTERELAASRMEVESARTRERARLEELRRSGAAVDSLQRASEAGRQRIAALESRLRERETDADRQRRDAQRLAVEVSRLQRELAERDAREAARARETARALADLAGPEVSLIDPPLTLTRGLVVRAAAPTVTAAPTRIVGRVTAPAGLLKLTLNGAELDVNEYGVFSTPFAAAGESARVAIVAIDRQGKQANIEFEVRPPGPGPTLAKKDDPAAQLAAERAALGNARYHALIIGNNDYARLQDLKTPIDDARKLEEILRTRYGFATTVLTNATRYDILSALNALREKLTSDDRLLIYYAGHGELDELNSRSYWLPVDAEPDSNANWIPTVAITDLLNIIRARHVLLVVDSCYAGALTRSSVPRLSTALTRAERLNWLRKVAEKRSRTVMTSGGVAPVLDSGGGAHSVFARALLEVLEKNDRLIDGQTLFREIAARVTYAAENVGFDQVPEYAPIRFAGHEGGEFHFVPAS